MQIRACTSLAEVRAAFTVAGALFDPPFTPESSHHWPVLEAAWPGNADLCVVAVDDDRIRGAALGVQQGEGVFLTIVAVEPGARGGTGRTLIEAVEAAAIGRGLSSVSLGARPEARGFYERLGYSGGTPMTKPLHGQMGRWSDVRARAERMAELRRRRAERRSDANDPT